jgi:hypothetical protein
MAKKVGVWNRARRLTNPIWLRNTLLGRVLLPLLYPTNRGHYILDEKWDHLVVLDACRYDTFKKVI